jgi:cytoskeletal protein RodZ
MALKNTLPKSLTLKRVLLIIIGIVIVLSLLEVTGVTHFFHKQTSGSTIPSKANRVSGTSSYKTATPTSTSSASSSTSQKNGTANTANSSAPLVEPSGTFASNHTPGKNDTSTNEQSVCTTTPGASCQIQFTKAGVTKSLESQVADPTGATYWSWDVKDSGLTAGSWKVSAVATLNGQTKTADDVIPLEIQ